MSHSHDGLSNSYYAAPIFLGNLHMLLYADDTVMLVEYESELQAAISDMYLGCKCWKLQFNILKTLDC